ncbi:hypothetical protein CGCFRS4_v014216 [Colletotrichum fructicola]|nr:hypothetical protein CGCFRS4_v014216 [Colletotrichum fructicola]
MSARPSPILTETGGSALWRSAFQRVGRQQPAAAQSYCSRRLGQIQSSELEQMRAEDYASKMEVLPTLLNNRQVILTFEITCGQCALASLGVSGICGQLRNIRISDGSPSPAREAEAEHMMT